MRHPLRFLSAAAFVVTLILAAPSARADISPGGEAAIGGAVLVVGYGMGSAPAVLGSTRDGGGFNRPTNADVQSLIPVVGPMIWWFQANDRINARIARDNASTCHNEDSAFDCLSLNPFDRAMHVSLALPWMIVSSAAQAGGVVVALHGLARSSPASSGEKKTHAAATMWLVPGPRGVGVAGTF